MAKYIKIRILDSKNQEVSIDDNETVITALTVKEVHDYSGVEQAELSTSKIAVVTEKEVV